MSKQEREQKARWRDEAKTAVARARTEEASRPKDERESLPKRQFLQERASQLLSLASLTDVELKTKEFWLNKMIVGKTPAHNPDAPRLAPPYEAWPVEGEIPDWVKTRFADGHRLWNALAQPIQHAISSIRIRRRDAARAIYKEAEQNGLNTEDEHVRKALETKIKAALKEIDFSPLQNIEEARKVVLREAYRIRDGEAEDPEVEMKRLGWGPANWNFALEVSRLPAWLQRVVEGRITAGSKARRTRRAGARESWSKGYPRPDLDERSGEGGIDMYFNGANLDWFSGEMKNSYVQISAPWNPPDHRGARKGKYRASREMRKIVLREPESNGQNRFALNVLFHSVPPTARMKQYKLRARRDPNGKIHWFFIPTFELAEALPNEQRSSFVGVDVGWRKFGEEEFIIAHSWDEVRGYLRWTGRIGDNRWSRRHNARQAKLPAAEQLPIRMTPEGLRDFASKRGEVQRDFKARMAAILDASNARPTNWDRTGRRGMSRMMTQEKSPEFLMLQSLRADYEAWTKRDQEIARIYRTAWLMVSDNLDRQRRQIARTILAEVTDIGIEALNVKKMAEAENEGESNWERHIENEQDRSRQLTGPAKFKLTLASVARKMGKRVHWINPAYTSKRCSVPECRFVNEIGPGELFVCAGCGRKWNRDENASRNLAQLARECAGSDTHPRKCSRDGKKFPFHGFSKSS